MNAKNFAITCAVLCLPFTATAVRAETDMERIEEALKDHEDQLFEISVAIAERTGGDPGEIGGQLETLAIYNEQRSQYFRPDWAEANMPATPDRSILSAVPKVKTSGNIRLTDIDAAIAADEMFLTSPGNATNIEYVENRLEAMRNVRQQAIEFLEGRMAALAKRGDEILIAQTSSFTDLEKEALAAQQVLDAAAAAKGEAKGTKQDTERFIRTLNNMRNIQQGRHRAEVLGELRQQLISVITDKNESGGEYEVLLLHIRTESWGGIGYKPGDKATLAVRDTYSVVSGTMEKLQQSKVRWYNTYDYDWCRFTGGGVDKVTRASLEIIARQAGLADSDADMIRDTASKLFESNGFENNRLGYLGPLHEVPVQITVPKLIAEYPKCKN